MIFYPYIHFEESPGVFRWEILDALGFLTIIIDILVGEQTYFLST